MKALLKRFFWPDNSEQESRLEEEAKARYKSLVVVAGQTHPAFNAAVDILRAVLTELGLSEGEHGYYTRYADGSMSFGNWGSFWYIEFRYRAAQIWEDHGAEAAEQYIRAQLREKQL